MVITRWSPRISFPACSESFAPVSLPAYRADHHSKQPADKLESHLGAWGWGVGGVGCCVLSPVQLGVTRVDRRKKLNIHCGDILLSLLALTSCCRCCLLEPTAQTAAAAGSHPITASSLSLSKCCTSKSTALTGGMFFFSASDCTSAGAEHTLRWWILPLNASKSIC